MKNVYLKHDRIYTILLPILFGILVLAVWMAWVSRAGFALWIVPKPIDILEVFVNYPGLLWLHSKTTIVETLAGLVLSIGLGTLTAIGMDRWKRLNQTLFPYLIVTQTIPIIAVAPLIILWFGYGVQAKIFIVTLVCFFPICISLYDGFQQMPVEYFRLFRSMQASKWQIFWLLKFPSALPAFFTGLKLAASYSVMAAVIGEWLGGESGLGIYMTRAAKSYQTAQVFAIIIVISVLSLILYGLTVLTEHSLLKWKFVHQAEYVDTKERR